MAAGQRGVPGTAVPGHVTEDSTLAPGAATTRHPPSTARRARATACRRSCAIYTNALKVRVCLNIAVATLSI